jgi:hypothetical protein
VWCHLWTGLRLQGLRSTGVHSETRVDGHSISGSELQRETLLLELVEFPSESYHTAPQCRSCIVPHHWAMH